MPEERTPLVFMLDPDSWPQWPWLPVVKRGSNPRSGALYADGLPRVYEVNLFNIPYPLPEPIVYDSFKAILEDGWEID